MALGVSPQLSPVLNSSSAALSSCQASVGVATDLHTTTYGISGLGQAPGVETATTIICEVREGGPTGALYGTVSGSEPGSDAAGAGTVAVPRSSQNPVLCVYVYWLNASGPGSQPVSCA